MVDRYDKLEAVCRNGNIYPTNLLRSRLFRHTLRSYQQRLNEEQDRLFDPSPDYALVELLEVSDGQKDFVHTRCKSLASLQQHFQVNRKDPRCRHVFFESDHSRAPLDCPKEMFVYVMSFLQVMAPFMDLLFGFGRPPAGGGGKEFHYTSFRHENFLGALQAAQAAIPRLGRSGREIRQCYNLWSAEEADANDGGSPWRIRQTAIFHSFDVEEGGRSVWVNISANDEMRDRVVDATKHCEDLRPASLHDLCGSFAATLTTHVIAFEWCGENWRRYIGSIESNLRSVLDKVNNVPVEDVERMLAVDSGALLKPLLPSGNASSWQPTGPRRTFTLQSSVAPVNPANRVRTGLSTASAPVNRVPTGLSTASSPIRGTRPASNMAARPLSPPMSPLMVPAFSPLVTGNVQQPQAQPQPQPAVDQTKAVEDSDPFEPLRGFSLEELQRLNGIGADLHTASLVMKLDAEVLGEQLEYYQSLWTDDEFPASIKSGCTPHLSEFSQRVKTIIRSLEMEQARIATLMLLLNDGRDLFDKLLQFRNIEQSKLFTANAHQSAQRMEDVTMDMHRSTLNMEEVTESMHKIAEKTERETASMHIITLVTLVFLPGTFVAVRLGLPMMRTRNFDDALLTRSQTFFSSGMFQWDQNNPWTSSPIWKQELFVRFAAICFPLMGATILIWVFLAYVLPQWRASKKKAADEEAAMAGLSEKTGLE
ncbi:hypothetical protein B0T22DRAFT_458015 [Podospora appendiculata]|uniref:CorA-like transporter domain-containing protein n=1 Tax=Podospora appendiculata TaxID=314037 RepID=A0AAE0X8F8_9PEZI|nr:hypothetical protein B0T22DRAFT_458015 [Podospora appendiculata]